MKKIIFDMDGVIVDSEYTYLESKTLILKDAGFEQPVSYQYQFMGTTYDYQWQVMKEELDLPEDIQYYIDEMSRVREDIIQKDGVLSIKHAEEVIEALGKKGHQMAVASSSPKNEIERNLSELNLVPYFEYLVSGEEVEHSKPAPDVFLRAADLLGEEPENCVVIEDTKNGVKAAKSAGMYCIGFRNPDYPEQDLSLADQIITDLKDLEISK